ncbi:MAG: carbohydrate binding domain-containing protein [Acidobacteriota bacterium]|nr:carbohydrate binding domain-containing protein [Acidobacteriota bacterium]
MTHSDQLKLISVRNPLGRALLAVPVALALLFAWYAARWYVGNFVAEFAPNMDQGQLEAAQEAASLAPDDPWTHWIVAGLKKRNFSPEDLNEAIRQYEEAVRLSPYDYRFWIDLGRSKEEAGDSAGGERALRRAVELAPHYAYTHWFLGNLLLRAGRGEEAFAELRRAAEADPQLRPQLFNVAWTLYGQDIEAVRKAVADTPSARADFATYLAGQGRADDALALWSSLSSAEKREASAPGREIMRLLLSQKRYRSAFGVLSDIKPGMDPKASQLINGGFEEDISSQAGDPFSWQVKMDPQAQVGIDESNSHGGSRSLLIFFRATEPLNFNNVSQTVVIEPSTQYRLEFYIRAEELKSAAAPVVQILDGADGATVLGTSQPAPPGSYDWQPVTINFRTPPKTEAVIVVITRARCDDPVCPIFGKVWYDDFNIQPVSGAVNQRGSGKANK